jgi:hypothetical protein
MKQKILIWANCQGNALKFMLNKYCNNMYEIYCYKNYEFIRNNKSLPEEFKNTDIFIYQNYSNSEGEYSLKYIINDVLKKDCCKICFPTLHSCELLFCYDMDEPQNNKTITSECPFGKFYFGIEPIQKLIKNNESIENIIKISKEDNFIDITTIEYYKEKTFSFLKSKCSMSDIPEIYDFIEQNFTKIRLWHNKNHPTGILLNELVKLVFYKLNLNYPSSLQDIEELEKKLNDWVLPIFPCVKKYYGMDFKDNCSSWYSPEIKDTDTFIRSYITDLY